MGNSAKLPMQGVTTGMKFTIDHILSLKRRNLQKLSRYFGKFPRNLSARSSKVCCIRTRFIQRNKRICLFLFVFL